MTKELAEALLPGKKIASVQPVADKSQMSFADNKPKAWKDIWGSGQGIGAVKEVVGAGELVDRLAAEYAAARTRLGLPTAASSWAAG